MKQIQEKVKIFCEENKLSLSIEHRVLDTMSEIGELSKEILKASNYGNKPIVLNDKMRLEFGDILFSLITIANSLEIDLDESINQVLEKYQKRIKKNFSPSSNFSNTSYCINYIFCFIKASRFNLFIKIINE